MRPIAVSTSALKAVSRRNSYGSVRTYCRTGTSGRTRSTMAAAVLAMRLPVQLGHTVRVLQENATSKKRFEIAVYKTVENGLGRTAGQIRGGERGHGAVPFADRVPPSTREIPAA
jgi:hypothetical protein